MTSSEVEVTRRQPGELETASHPLAALPWRDPHTVSPERLQQCIQDLQEACREDPQSANLRTCLGIAHAVNLDVYKSFDSLEEARRLDPQNFWAQQKYAELLYRMRALGEAEPESLKALELANTHLELAVARKLLAEVRQKYRDGTNKPVWTRPLLAPAAVLVVMMAAAALMGVLR